VQGGVDELLRVESARRTVEIGFDGYAVGGLSVGESRTEMLAALSAAVSELGATPIDYQRQDFVQEMLRLTDAGVDVVFDGMGGTHMWRSRKALRRGGRVVVYGLTGSLRGGRLASGRPGRRRRFHGMPLFALYIAAGWLLPGRRRFVPYSIQWLKRLRPALFRQDLTALLALLREHQIKPLIAQRFPLAEAQKAHEALGKGGVTGKIVLTMGAA